MSNILLLDRNIDEAERISSYFEARSYAVIWPKTIADLLYHVVHRDFCLAILDVALSAEDDHRFLDTDDLVPVIIQPVNIRKILKPATGNELLQRRL